MAKADAAVAIVHAGGSEGSVLLIRRAERESDPWSGHWSFPGGRHDPGDPDPLHTALRELEEECGIRLARGQMRASLPPVHARRRSGPFLLVAPFVFGVEAEMGTVLDAREAAESRWIPLDVLRDAARHRVIPVPGAPPDAAFPCVPLDGPPLWGFTYRLATQWLGLLPDSGAAMAAANRLLEFLLQHGLRLRQAWRDGKAVVEGPIPVAAVMGELALPGRAVPAVNMVEVRREAIRVVGLDYEEYWILGA